MPLPRAMPPASMSAKVAATLAAPSGRCYLRAKEDFPKGDDVPQSLRGEVLEASKGDIIELLERSGEWAYGAPLIKNASGGHAIGERGPRGAFRLAWVCVVRVSLDSAPPSHGTRSGGSSSLQELNTPGLEAFLRAPQARRNVASRFHSFRDQQRLERIGIMWTIGTEPANSYQAVSAMAALQGLKKSAAAKFTSQRRELPPAPHGGIIIPVPVPPSTVDDVSTPVLQALAGLSKEAKPSAPSPSKGLPPQPPPAEAPAAQPLKPGLLSLTPAPPTQAARIVAAIAAATSRDRSEVQVLDLSSALSFPQDPSPTSTAAFATGAGGAAAAVPVAMAPGPAGERAVARGGAAAEVAMDTLPENAQHMRSGGTRERFAGNLRAKRSGELEAVAGEWRNAKKAIVSSASDMQSLKERFVAAVLSAHRTGELRRVTADLAREVEEKADEFQRLRERALSSLEQVSGAEDLEGLVQEMENDESNDLWLAKQRALRSLLEMNRSGDLERLAGEMGDAQARLEAKAAQLREIATRMTRGLREAKRSGELERIAGEMTQMLDNKADVLRGVRMSLIRARRTGELLELRREFDELADEVPGLPAGTAGAASSSGGGAGGADRAASSSGEVGASASSSSRWLRGGSASASARRRWSEMTSSGSDLDPSINAPGILQNMTDESSDDEGVRRLRSLPLAAALAEVALPNEASMASEEPASSDGGEESSLHRRLARCLLRAKRSGELQALAEAWQGAETAMESSASEMRSLRQRFEAVMLGAASERDGEGDGDGDMDADADADADLDAADAESSAALQRLAACLTGGEASQSTKNKIAQPENSLQLSAIGSASHLRSLLQRELGGMNEEKAQERRLSPAPPRQRALRGLLAMKRSGELDHLAKEMKDTQEKLEVKSAQLREIAARMRRGLRDAQRSGELQRLAGEMTQMLDTKADSIRRVRQSLIRARRNGELLDLRREFDELADEVPNLPLGVTFADSGAGGNHANGGGGSNRAVGRDGASNGRAAKLPAGSDKRRWSELTSSGSDYEPPLASPHQDTGESASEDDARIEV